MITSLGATELHARLGRLSRRVDDVAQMSWTLTSHRTREQILSALLDLALRAVHAEVGGVFQRDSQGLHAEISMGLDAGVAEQLRCDGQSVMDRVGASRQAVMTQLRWDADIPRNSLRVRSLLAVPIIVDSECQGTLLLAHGRDGEPFCDEDREAAMVLAALAAVSIQNAEWLHRTVEQQRLEQQMGMARLVQRTLLPAPGCGPAWLTWESCYRPAHGVGGDYFDIIPLHGEAVAVAMGDVSDHGLPAALLMTAVRSLLRSECLRGSGPARMLTLVNRSLCEDSGHRHDLLVSLFVAFIHSRARTVTYANAGHPPPLLWDAARLVPAPLAVVGPPLGQKKDAIYAEGNLPLGPAYRLFLFSDGLTEAGTPRGDFFGLPRVCSAASEQCGLPGAEFVLAMRRRIEAFSECAHPRDDLTMLWLGESRAS